MEIGKDTVVSIDYRLKNDEGKVLDESSEGQPLQYLHGHSNIVQGLENALDGKSAGDEVSVRLEPVEGYGEVREDLRQVVPRAQFQGVDQLEIGMQFQAQTPQGPVPVKVAKIEGDDITIDANHPLAGVPLNFEVKVNAVREATDDEVSHGHVH